MKVVKISELRRNLQDIVDSVYYTHLPVIVMRRKKPRAMIVPLPQDDSQVEKAIKKYEDDARETS
jgi:prevent-host-death family protein